MTAIPPVLVQLDWRFWLCGMAIFIVIRLRPPVAASTWWGILNFAALGVLLGFTATAVIFLFTVALWMILYIARQQNQILPRAYACAAFPILFILVWQKVMAEMGSEEPILSSLRLLELLSFSYVSLRAWDVISAARDGERLLNPLALSAYLAPFFMMPAGPINGYRDHLAIDKRDGFAPPSWGGLLRGVEQIIWGLFMKFVLAELLRLYVIGLNGTWPTERYFDSLVAFFYVYLDFAGYSLIALGFGKLLGVPTPVNFNRPFLARSLTDFWTRWHMSLGEWVKRNLYFPMQLALMRRIHNRAGYAANMISLIAGFIFVGLWHRATWPFFVWGALFGTLVAIEKVIRDKFGTRFLKAHPVIAYVTNLIAPIYVIAIVVATLHFTAISQMIGTDR